METKTNSLNQDTNLLASVKNIIMVTSGKGGVGKSTVALNIALELAQMNLKIGLLDADLYGPNIPNMLGITDISESDIKDPQNENLLYPIQKNNLKIMSMQFFIQNSQAVIWRGPILSKVASQFLFNTHWGDLDYLILDMPPGTGDIDLTIIQQVPITGCILVTTPQSSCILDTQRNIEMLNKMRVPILGIVENMCYFIPDDDPNKKYDIFGSNNGDTVKNSFEVPILGRIPIEGSLSKSHPQPFSQEKPKNITRLKIKEIALNVLKNTS